MLYLIWFIVIFILYIKIWFGPGGGKGGSGGSGGSGTDWGSMDGMGDA